MEFLLFCIILGDMFGNMVESSEKRKKIKDDREKRLRVQQYEERCNKIEEEKAAIKKKFKKPSRNCEGKLLYPELA